MKRKLVRLRCRVRRTPDWTIDRAGVPRPTGVRVLLAGWFSWEGTGTTAGDLLARDVACEWLERAGRAYDVANASPFGPGVDWREVDPAAYSEVLFVCGPLTLHYTPLRDLLRRFAGSRHVGLDVSMVEDPERWNPFDVLLERDSVRRARPDLAFAAREPRVPLVGIVLVEPYTPEYPRRDKQDTARAAALRVLDSRPLTRVSIDTRLPENPGGLRTAAEVESLIAGMDAVVTTRLHGLVLAIKNGVPALVIDPVQGGSKLLRQAAAIGWPVVRTPEALDDRALRADLDLCLRDAGRELARECAGRARSLLEEVERELAAALSGPSR
jgi:hypothetical protein